MLALVQSTTAPLPDTEMFNIHNAFRSNYEWKKWPFWPGIPKVFGHILTDLAHFRNMRTVHKTLTDRQDGWQGWATWTSSVRNRLKDGGDVPQHAVYFIRTKVTFLLIDP